MQNTKKTLIRLHVGLNDRTGRACHPDHIRSARRRIETDWEGFTITGARGLWNTKQEPAWIVEHYADDTRLNLELARFMCLDLAKILNQECIGLACLPVQSFGLIHGGE